MEKDNLKLIVMDNCLHLGLEVDKHLKLIRNNPNGFIVKSENPTFSNSEGKAQIYESVRGSDLFILSDVGNHDIEYNYFGIPNRKSFNDNYVDTLSMIDACANTPNRIWLVMPMLYASRQHKRESRESLNCAQSLKIYEFLGVKGIITFDVHDPTVRSALNKTSFDTIYVTNTMLEHFLNTENINFNNLLVIHPDRGASKRAKKFGEILSSPVGGFEKVRDTSKVINGTCQILSHEYIGSTPLEGKNLIVVDDMIASGKSMIDVARSARLSGSDKVYLFTTFGLFSDGEKSVDDFNEAYAKKMIEKVYVTNLTYIPNEIKKLPWIEIVDCAPTLSRIISTLHDNESIAPFMDGEEEISEKVMAKKLITQHI